jgi:signal transduction histidine kinase/ligand-binding sensor domain-containing protein
MRQTGLNPGALMQKSSHRRWLDAALIRLQLSNRCFLFLIVVFSAHAVSAVDPHRLISQYGHTSWKDRDEVLNNPAAITQTTDGYIWILDSAGLLRFDGVKFARWLPPKDQQLPRGAGSLLGARDGSLWIGAPGGLAQLKDGALFNYSPQIRGSGVSQIIEDHAGTIWFTRYRIRDGEGPLCQVTNRQVQCYGEKDGIPATYGLGLAEDTSGNIWFGSSMLCRWAPGSSSVYFEQELKNLAGYGVVAVVAGPSGSIWAGLDGTGPKFGVRHYSNGKWASYVLPGFDGTQIRSQAMLLDRNLTLWIGTESKGLYHVHDGVADHYGRSDGLSSDTVGDIYEDKEGNIWVLTQGGIDLFRDTPVLTFSDSQGLIGADVSSVLALRDGSILVGNEQALDIIRSGAVSALVSGKGLPGQNVGAMFQDRAGQVWLGIDKKLMIYEHGRFSEVKKANGAPLGDIGPTRSITEDRDGKIWAVAGGNNQIHLFRIKDRRMEEDTPLENSMPRARYLAADRDSGVWIVSEPGSVARYRNGHMEALALNTGGDTFRTYSLSVDSENAVWVTTGKGLYRLKDGHFNVLDSANGLPCDSIYSMINDNYGSVWLYARCGLLKITASDLATWMKDPQSKLPVKTFGLLDGAQILTQNDFQPVVSMAPNGQLWFASGRFVQMIDPGRSYLNTIAPPVFVEEVVADRKTHDWQSRFDLPPLRGELEINYTALSFTLPQRVKFRYKLEGHDTEWQEAGTRRQAFYNDLRPGNYQFRVTAGNNDGVWNENGATLDFSIAPAWYQTRWFLFLCVLSGLLLVWALYRLRVRQIRKSLGARFDERLSERTRMARELHDTFLQTLQGSKLVAEDALEKSSDPVQLRRAMEKLLVWLEQAVREGRTALNSLRTSTTQTNDLAEAFKRAAEETRMQSLMEVSFSVTGDSREIHPVVRDEIYRIGYEAIRNAYTHSKGNCMEVDLRYGRDLSVRVSDNGTGIDPTIAYQGKDGHFGLQGMRERAIVLRCE